MKTQINIIAILIILFTNQIFAQHTKEVILVGTMHQLPKIAKHAYKPMLNKAISYQPQAIYIERAMKEDSVSLKNYFPKFYQKADSLSKIMKFDSNILDDLRNKELTELTYEEAKMLANYYYTQKDYANFKYYCYISKFGDNGAGKMSNRTENMDLSYPLGVKMNIPELRSMDDQTYYKEYWNASVDCNKAGRTDGGAQDFKKVYRKANFRDVIGFLTGLGKSVNSEKTAALYHNINSFEFRKTSCEPCDKANYYWDYRNAKMARNIATQIRANDEVKNMVIVGAGHLYGLVEAFERDHPDIKVKMYSEL